MEAFWTIGSVLAVIATFFTIIYIIPSTGQIIRSSILWLWHWLKSRPIAIKEKLYWRRYSPTWKIISLGSVSITYENNVFKISIPIKVEYESRDNRYPTTIICEPISLNMYTKGKGRDKIPYRLNGTPRSSSITLRPQKCTHITYTFTGIDEAKPLIGKTVTIKIMDVGVAMIKHIQEKRLKSGRKLKVIVVWETNNDL